MVTNDKQFTTDIRISLSNPASVSQPLDWEVLYDGTVVASDTKSIAPDDAGVNISIDNQAPVNSSVMPDEGTVNVSVTFNGMEHDCGSFEVTGPADLEFVGCNLVSP